MAKFLISGLIVCFALVGCSGGGDEAPVNSEQTQGGNVVNDPALKERLTGPAGGANAASSSAPSMN